MNSTVIPMFCRTGFYFTKNTSVLTTLAQSKVSRLSIVSRPKFRLAQMLSRFRSMPLKRQYSTISVTSEAAKLSSNTAKPGNGSKYPVISNKVVGYWLIGTSSLIFGIVVLGGLTRLTESGLSITEWKPITGTIPPMNEAEWIEEFSKYKNSPEFQQLNSHITLDEFKFIFSMEWGHRLVGRCIGMFFILPALYFWKSGRFSRHITAKVVGLTALLGLQGAIGWWMVKSGLDEEELANRRSKPTVSQYRLTTHLGAAFLMYLGVLWTGFEILSENKLLSKIRQPDAVKAIIEQLNNPALKRIRTVSAGLLALTFVTAMSGGMVAGLDAGLIYNTFPHMGDDYIPSGNELFSTVYCHKADHSDLWWRNLLENPTTVQLVHRIMATTTFFAILGAHLFISKNKAVVPKPALNAARTVMGLASLQVALGISTLIYLVPIPLAAAHQAGALALLTGCLTLSARLKKIRPSTIEYINKTMKDQLLKNRKLT